MHERIYENPKIYQKFTHLQVRISGFNEGESQFGEFPWVAMVLKNVLRDGESKNELIGGATIIHPRVLLTAAHKVEG